MSDQSFLIIATENDGKPELINIYKSDANKHAIRVYNKRSFLNIKVRLCKYLNSIAEQDHRLLKRESLMVWS